MVMASMRYWIYLLNMKFETEFIFLNFIKMLNGKTKRRIQSVFVSVELLSTEGVPQTKSLTICNMCLPFIAFDLFHSLCRAPVNTFFPMKSNKTTTMHATHDLTYAHTVHCTSIVHSVPFAQSSFILSSTPLVFYVIFVAFISSSSGFNERPGNPCAETLSPRTTHTHTMASIKARNRINHQTAVDEFSLALEVNMCMELFFVLPLPMPCYYCRFTSKFLRNKHMQKWPENRKWIYPEIVAEWRGREREKLKNTCRVFRLPLRCVERISTINLANGNKVARQMTYASMRKVQIVSFRFGRASEIHFSER